VTQDAIRCARLAALAALLAVGLISPAPASGTAATADPTLTLTEICADFQGVRITLVGFPPNTPYTATIEDPGGGAGPGQATSGPNGEFFLLEYGAGPGTYTFTIVWAGGTIQESITVDCTFTITKADCRDDGWRRFDFRNQGECISFAERGPKGKPTLFLDAECRPLDPYGGTFETAGLQPNTYYLFQYVTGGGVGSFQTSPTGSASAGGSVASEPFAITVRIWLDADQNRLLSGADELVMEAHFTIDQPCEDIFPDPT
jgi:hypothetical protein